MTRQEAARLLHVSEATLSRWVRQGLLHAANPEGTRFDRRELEAWAAQRGIVAGGERGRGPAHAVDLLAAAIARGAVTRDVRPADASAAIVRAVEAVPGLDAAARADVLDRTLARERMAGTGLGYGVALPHPRKPVGEYFREPVVSLLFPDEPVDWAAVDGAPVHTVFLLLSPSAPVHLEVLSRIAFVVRQPELLSFLRTRPDTAAIVERLAGLTKEP